MKLKKIILDYDNPTDIPKELIEINNNNFLLFNYTYYKKIFDTYQKEFKTDKLLNIFKILNFIKHNDTHHNKSLRRIDRDYTDIIDYLLDIRVIYKYEKHVYNYKEGENNKAKPRKFILNYEVSSKVVIILLDSKNIKNKIDKSLISKNYYKTLIKTDIDVVKCILDEKIYLDKDEDNENKRKTRFEKRIYNVIKFKAGYRYLKKGKKVNRIFSSFSDLSSVSRKNVYILKKGIKYFFHEIDLKNAQPYLLACFLISKFKHNSLNLIKDTENGIFYEKIQNRVLSKNILNETVTRKSGKDSIKTEYYDYTKRSDIKTSLYYSIFFGLNDTETSKAFIELYKTEYENLIKYLKIINNIPLENKLPKKLKNKLAKQLQNTEASTFLKIDLDDYFFTCHDAIYFTRDELKDTISQIISENFYNTLGVKFNGILELTKNTNNSDTEYNYNIIDNISIITVEDKQTVQLRKLIEQGKTNKEISEIVGISLSTVKRRKKLIK